MTAASITSRISYISSNTEVLPDTFKYGMLVSKKQKALLLGELIYRDSHCKNTQSYNGDPWFCDKLC